VSFRPRREDIVAGKQEAMSILLATRDKDLEDRCRRAASADYSIELVVSADAIARRIATSRPDVVLVDAELLAAPIESAVAGMVAQAGAGRVIVLTAEFNEDEEVALLRCGVKGCCRRGVDPESLRQVLSVTQSGVWVTRSLLPRLVSELRRYAQQQTAAPAAASVATPASTTDLQRSQGDKALARLPADKLASLTRRELDIVKLIADGASNKEVGVALDISDRTVKGHLSNIFLKLGTPDRMKLMLYLQGEKLQTQSSNLR
jgi:two-component system, NarL family, nitrate/nitrite response regulator NarL